jgi:threonine/homoserine/homoserine lactone efflux protein
MFVLVGIIIGMIVAFPIGPLGLLSIQRTINRGWKIGLLSGLGAVTSDLIYSSMAIVGVSFIGDFVERNRYLINGVTGILFLIVGINILISAIEKIRTEEAIKEDIIHPFFSNFLMGLSNPITFLLFFAIFTKIGIDMRPGEEIEHTVFIISIYGGSMALWFLITNLIEKSNRNYKLEKFIFMDKLIGILIILFGVFSILKGLMLF